MEGDNELNLTLIVVELDSVLNQMEKRLVVTLPVRSDPVGDQICLHHINLQIVELGTVVEGRKEFEQVLGQRAGQTLEFSLKLVHVQLGVRHLAADHVRHDATRAPNDS